MAIKRRPAALRRRNGALLILLLLAVSVFCCSAGGTLAWLIAMPEPLVNTFTYGDIDITLTETDTGDGDNDVCTNRYKMMPGAAITKDPLVTVTKGSESCWLFVKLEKSANFDEFMEFTPADGWLPLADAAGSAVEGVFYRSVTAEKTAASDQAFAVLLDDTVTVEAEVTKAQLNALTEETFPKLTVTAYAVQYAGFEPAAAEGTAPTEAETAAAAYRAWSIAAQADAPEAPGNEAQ